VRGVPFVEQEIQHVEHTLEPFAQLVLARDLDRDLLLADLALGADEALSDGIRLREEGRRDLSDAESADSLERQRDAAGVRQGWMTAHEHHGELVVQGGVAQLGLRKMVRRAVETIQLAAERDVAPDEIEGAMLGNLKEPRSRLCRHPAEGPRLERADQRVLHGLLGEVEPRRAEPAREPRHHLARAVAEEVLDECVDVEGRGRVLRARRQPF